MAFHCGAPTRDGSACQRHVREPGTRCPQHRNLGGTALHPPRHALRTITLADPALTSATTGWTAARADLRARAGELLGRTTPPPEEESAHQPAGTLGDEELMTEDAEPATEAGADEATAPPTPVGQRSYLDRERGRRALTEAEATAEDDGSEPATADAEPDADANGDGEPEPDALADGEFDAVVEPDADADADASGGAEGEPEADPESKPAEQRPLLRKERALDPDWIGARPMFRDEAPTRPLPRIEFEPSADAPRKPPRVAPMRSVVLGAQAEPDPPTLIDRMPPIDPNDLAVPDFLRPGFTPSASAPEAKAPPTPRPAPQPAKPRPVPKPDPPTLVDPHPPIVAGDISVPDFIVPGFAQPAPKPPLRTVLSTVLGPDLWQRCYTEWSPAHCTTLARIARAVDGLAPSATTAVRSTAGAGMRWLGVAREREMLADLVADAISHPAGATTTNQARTVRLYGAAICMALNLPLRRCTCHRDLERDVSSELIRLGLEELAGEVP